MVTTMTGTNRYRPVLFGPNQYWFVQSQMVINGYLICLLNTDLNSYSKVIAWNTIIMCDLANYLTDVLKNN